MKHSQITRALSLLTASAAILCVSASVQGADKKPNIVMLMTDDTGWGDFGCYGGGQNLGHPIAQHLGAQVQAHVQVEPLEQ